jgi:iodotyrosine deiodinase
VNWPKESADGIVREVTRPHTHPFIPYTPPRLPIEDGLDHGRAFHRLLDGRRFSPDPVPRQAIELAVQAANTAPSGAHQQPWRFVATQDPELKRRIREAAEEEERRFYHERELPHWHAALARLETDADKEFLEVAPWLVGAFAQKQQDGKKTYYTNESVGIACGFFIAALHSMGLATLTHTPNPMTFLTDLLGRDGERPYILFPIGYPADDCEVPDLHRKPLSEALTFAGGLA